MRVVNLKLKLLALGTFTLACVGIFLYLFQAAGGNLRLSAPYTVKAAVPDAFQLVNNADVRRAGVKIGKVRDVTDTNGHSLVTFELQSGQTPIYRDARVLVRTKTLVGENYLSIEPGTPSAGKVPDGGALPLKNSDDAVQLDQILSSLDSTTRSHVRANLRTLGTGLQAHGKDLNALFGEARPLAEGAHAVLGVLAKQKTAVARLIGSTGDVLQAIGERKQDLRTLAVAATRSAQAASSRDTALAAALHALPATLKQAKESTARLGAFSNRATPTITTLRSAARNLGPVVQDLYPTATQGRALFRQLPGLIKVANPLLDKLSTFATATSPTIDKLGAFLGQANPALTYLKPFNTEFGAFFANVGSALDTHDALGNIGRVFGVLSENSVGALTVNEQKAIDALIKAGGLEKVHYVGSNSYPKAGSIGSPLAAGDGNYPSIPAPSGSGR